MSDELTVVVGFVAALLFAMPLTELARRLAVRTSFYDHPVGYKGHTHPTPYLGGLAVIGATLLASAIFARGWGDYTTLTVCAIAVLAVGLADDRRGLGVTIRFGAQIGSAIFLWAVGMGWEILATDGANLALTIVWVVGIVNAFNLMDNQDGAASTVAAACGVGIAALALIQGAPGVAALAATLAGACVGFLPFNLARPSKIFLGDGGSNAIGLILAATIMAIPDGALKWAMLLATAPLVGLPILDTTLVVISRLRRGAPVFSGARDHLTHRMLAMAQTPRAVAVALAVAQLSLCGLAIGLVQLDVEQVIEVTALYLGVGLGVIAWLDSRLTPRLETAPQEL